MKKKTGKNQDGHKVRFKKITLGSEASFHISTIKEHSECMPHNKSKEKCQWENEVRNLSQGTYQRETCVTDVKCLLGHCR